MFTANINQREADIPMLTLARIDSKEEKSIIRNKQGQDIVNKKKPE